LSLVCKRMYEKFYRELLLLLREFNVVIHSLLLKSDTAVLEDVIVSSIESIH